MPKQVPSVEIHDENARIVKGWGTVDVFDKANERLPIEEFKRIMPVIMKRGGLIMNKHSNQPVGKILNYEFRMKDTPEGPREGVYLTTEVFKDYDSDDDVWDDIKKERMEGFSFGGRNTLEDVDFSKGVSQKTLKGLEGHEFSYVPTGCNQESTFEEINYIAKSDVKKEDGETSNDSDHYHLYRVDENGDGATLGTLPREAEDHKHNIQMGVVQLENGHDHKLVRMLVEKVYDFGNKPDSEKTPKDEKEENTDDKTLSKSDSTLNTDGKKGESFIKNSDSTNNMTTDKPTEKIEEVPQAADSTEAPAPTEDPTAVLNAKMDKIIELLSGANKAEEEDKPEEPKEEEVAKEGDGEKVKLPESVGEESSQAKPAEGAKADEGAANFLEKEGIAKITEDIKKSVMKELVNKSADTPRPGAKANDIQKSESTAVAKNWAEANKMSRASGLK